MLKVMLWVVSNDGRFFNGALSILERQHNGIELVGVTAVAPIQIAKDGRNVPFVSLDEVDGGGHYDLLLVVGARQIGMSDITKAAKQLRLPEEKLLGDWIACIPGFTLKKYRQLQRSRLSIFSVNCFGGMISNLLGLPFRSPFVNLFLSSNDFLKFLRAPRIYMEEEPRFEKFFEYDYTDDAFPVLTLGNISLNMKHYKEIDAAVVKWQERKQRINWYNLLVISFAEDEKLLAEFDALPYGKKVCFTLFKSDLDSAWYINPEIDKTRNDLKTATDNLRGRIDNFGGGRIFYYDLFDMLLYGKKTPLIDM